MPKYTCELCLKEFSQKSQYTKHKKLLCKDNKVKWNEIMILLNEWKPELVIVGKPLNMDGTDSEIMKEVERFYQKLKSIYDAKFEYIDERLTTFEARQILEEKKFETVDANAAKILIDNWFELNKQ